MKKLLCLLLISTLFLVGCQQNKTTPELIKEYEDFITEANIEIQLVNTLLPIWQKSSADTKDTQLSMFYDSRKKLKDIGFNKDTKEFYSSLVEFNEIRLEIFNQTFDNVTGKFNQDKLTELNQKFKTSIQKVELEYNKLQ